MNRLKNIDHGFIDIDKLRYVKIIKDNKKDIEDKSNTTPYNSKLLSYINIYNGNRSKIHVTTPEMVCPFGLETKNGNVIKLQFTNYKSDQNMKSFYDFIAVNNENKKFKRQEGNFQININSFSPFFSFLMENDKSKGKFSKYGFGFDFKKDANFMSIAA